MKNNKPMLINESHLYCDAQYKSSPHFNHRPNTNAINLLVIHNISLPAGQFGLNYIDDLFMGCLNCYADPSFTDLSGVQVSAHLLIKRTGQVIQYVPFDKRAWHAGVSHYQGHDNCNDFSIGIELEGCDTIEYETAQYQALVKVTAQLMLRYPNITPKRIVGHCDIAPERKTDPGEAFNWTLFFKQLEKETV